MQLPIKLFALIVTTVLFAISCSKKSAGSSGNGGGGGNNSLHIDSISPASGPAGTLVTIYGTGFSATAAGDAVTVNGVSVPAVDATTQMISFTVPTGLVSGVVAVKVGNNTSTGPSFTYVPSAVVSLYAGGAGQGYGDGGLLVGQFDYIKALAIDDSDNLYVADGTRIRKVTPDGTINTLAGTTTPTYMDGPAMTAEFLDPQSIVVNPTGDHVYVGDEGSIRLITGGNVSTLSGTDVNTGVVYMDGSATATRFNVNIPGIWLDNNNNNIYVVDAANGRVRAVTGANGNSSTLSGNGNYGAAPAYGNMLSIAGDGQGSLFVA
ncbi:MAG TPA: IPT/TIG domain-containing protein, partial [Puia sp.]|nr:IPT/TIG domain-containing protein [Puia sp.]